MQAWTTGLGCRRRSGPHVLVRGVLTSSFAVRPDADRWAGEKHLDGRGHWTVENRRGKVALSVQRPWRRVVHIAELEGAAPEEVEAAAQEVGRTS